jgi:hypothetical protein
MAGRRQQRRHCQYCDPHLEFCNSHIPIGDTDCSLVWTPVNSIKIVFPSAARVNAESTFVMVTFGTDRLFTLALTAEIPQRFDGYGE